MSLPSSFLDNGNQRGAQFTPMASANFGAESGAYFLRSTPSIQLSQQLYPSNQLSTMYEQVKPPHSTQAQQCKNKHL